MTDIGKKTVVNCVRFIFGQIPPQYIRFISPDLLGELVAVCSYVSVKQKIWGIGDLAGKTLEGVKIKVNVDDSACDDVFDHPEGLWCCHSCVKHDAYSFDGYNTDPKGVSIEEDSPGGGGAIVSAEPVAVERKEGNTIFHIQNLNVYLSADVVTQLNINPQQVINVIQDRLNAELNNIVTTECRNRR